MNVFRAIVYAASCGRVSLLPHDAAVWDVESWVQQQQWTVGQHNAATSVIAALDEYPEIVTAIMSQSNPRWRMRTGGLT